MVEIRKVETRKDKKTFIQFANKLYKGCPYYCPTLDGDEYNTFSKKNPVMDFSEYELFLAYKNGGEYTGIIRTPFLYYTDSVTVLSGFSSGIIRTAF